MVIRPVFDPAIPGEVRAALADLGERLRPGSGLPSSLPGWGRQVGRDAVRAVGLGAVCALLPAALACTRMLGWAGRLAAVAAQVVVLAVWFASDWFTGGFRVAATVSGTVQVLCTAGAFVLMDAWQLRLRVGAARGSYLVSDDFAPESQVILARAQAAITAVTRSEVAAAGLLDDAGNDVVLSRQEWEIARMLARRTARAGRGGGTSGLAVRRVEALERYAEHVREADAALAERHAATGAASPAESAALAEIEDLSEYARQVGEAIRAAPGATVQPGAGSRAPRPGDE